jgi:hypothetical protein
VESTIIDGFQITPNEKLHMKVILQGVLSHAGINFDH